MPCIASCSVPFCLTYQDGSPLLCCNRSAPSRSVSLGWGQQPSIPTQCYTLFSRPGSSRHLTATLRNYDARIQRVYRGSSTMLPVHDCARGARSWVFMLASRLRTRATTTLFRLPKLGLSSLLVQVLHELSCTLLESNYQVSGLPTPALPGAATLSSSHASRLWADRRCTCTYAHSRPSDSIGGWCGLRKCFAVCGFSW